jgi:polyisoprenyl-phosphate glycosyltransferase
MIESLAVIVPVWNAAETLISLHTELTLAVENISTDIRFIYVDDASSDNSFSIIADLAESDSRVSGIRLAKNSGQQLALLCGIRAASSDCVVTIDDDLQYHPRYIPLLADAVEKGYDLVYGIPKKRSNSGIRNLGTVMTRLLLQLLCRKPANIEVSSFRIMRRSLAEAVARDTRAKVYISGTSFLEDPRAACIPIDTCKTRESRYSFRQLLTVFGNIVLYYTPILESFRDAGPQYTVKRIVGKQIPSDRPKFPEPASPTSPASPASPATPASSARKAGVR